TSKRRVSHREPHRDWIALSTLADTLPLAEMQFVQDDHKFCSMNTLALTSMPPPQCAVTLSKCWDTRFLPTASVPNGGLVERACIQRRRRRTCHAHECDVAR